MTNAQIAAEIARLKTLRAEIVKAEEASAKKRRKRIEAARLNTQRRKEREEERQQQEAVAQEAEVDIRLADLKAKLAAMQAAEAPPEPPVAEYADLDSHLAAMKAKLAETLAEEEKAKVVTPPAVAERIKAEKTPPVEMQAQAKDGWLYMKVPMKDTESASGKSLTRAKGRMKVKYFGEEMTITVNAYTPK